MVGLELLYVSKDHWLLTRYNKNKWRFIANWTTEVTNIRINTQTHLGNTLTTVVDKVLDYFVHFWKIISAINLHLLYQFIQLLIW